MEGLYAAALAFQAVGEVAKIAAETSALLRPEQRRTQAVADSKREARQKDKKESASRKPASSVRGGDVQQKRAAAKYTQKGNSMEV